MSRFRYPGKTQLEQLFTSAPAAVVVVFVSFCCFLLQFKLVHVAQNIIHRDIKIKQ